MMRARRKSTVPKPWAGALAAGLTCIAGPAPMGEALTLRHAATAIKNLPESTRHITFSTLDQSMRELLASHPSFDLYERGRVDFGRAVADFLRSASVNPLLEINGRLVSSSFGLSSNTKTLDFRFQVKGIPLCGFQVRGHELSDGSTVLMGTVPDIDPYEPAPSQDWPDFELARETAQNFLRSNIAASHISTRDPKRCFYVANGSLVPVWAMTTIADGAAYAIHADAYEVLSSAPLFFATTGTAKVFPNNRSEGTLTDIALPNLAGDGKLSSEFLRTVIPQAKQQASESTHVFAYPPEDYRFDEVMVYAHAQSHFEYMTSIGFAWYGAKPLEIKPHTPPQGRQNNALFEPGDASGSTLPTITIDDGDGKILQNLVSDGDVVSHEFGHHVIYQTLKTTSGESLVLHEGLSDFFVFSRTGDPCLGETICPEKSTSCNKVGQCLRTAANNVTYGDPLWKSWAGPYNRLGHLHGQVISGLLWDLRSSSIMPPPDLAKLTLKAVSLFAETSGFCDFLAALLAADRDLYASSHQDAIAEAAKKRGLDDYLQQASTCPVNLSSQVTPTGSETTNETSTKKKGPIPGLKCGVAQASDGTPRQNAWIGFLLLLVPALILRPIPTKALAKLIVRSRNSRTSRNK